MRLDFCGGPLRRQQRPQGPCSSVDCQMRSRIRESVAEVVMKGCANDDCACSGWSRFQVCSIIRFAVLVSAALPSAVGVGSGGASIIVCFGVVRVELSIAYVCLVSFGGAILHRLCALAWVGLRGGVLETPRSCCVVRQFEAARGGVAGRISGNQWRRVGGARSYGCELFAKKCGPKNGTVFRSCFWDRLVVG